MTRKEYETICRVLKDVGASNKNWPTAEQRACAAITCHSIAGALVDTFELTGEARNLFLERAGVTAPVTR